MSKRINREPYHHSWLDVLLIGGGATEKEELNSGIQRRIMFFSALTLGVLLLLFSRLFAVQVLSVDNYLRQANTNRIREIISYAPRGTIYDRHGKVIAKNDLMFQVSVTPFATSDTKDDRTRDAQRVAGIVDKPVKEVLQILSSRGRDFSLPLPVAEGLTHKQALVMESRLPNLEGYSVEQVPTRKYNAAAGLAHIVGYSGRVSQEDLDEYGDGLLPTDYVGKAGVEKSFDQHLRGTNGWKRIEVDALGRPVRVLEERPPQAGKDLYLSIDLEVQKSLAKSMKEQMQKANSNRSAGVMVSPKNGQVLAMVSIPYYDNNIFTGTIDTEKFAKVTNDPRQPLYNKVAAGGYTTGSIIKPLVASAALEEKVIDPKRKIVDAGYIDVVSQYGTGTFRFRGWRPEGLGALDIRGAIAMSSNIYFYTVGGGHGDIEGLGEERLTRYYRQFGLGEKTGIPLPNEIDGRVPDNEWKLENKGEPWYVGDSYNISIGQGDLLVSPLQITMAEASIANNGYLLQPHLERGAKKSVRREIPVKKSNLQIVREGMRQVLGGTTCECTFADVPVKVAGKSGTAETNTPGGRRPHAWYTAFAPYENPEVLATVLIEEGEGGSQFAAPAIAQTFETYFKR